MLHRALVLSARVMNEAVLVIELHLTSEKAGAKGWVMVVVGGAPVNEKYARDIGADGYAHDAGGGVKLVEQLLQGL